MEVNFFRVGKAPQVPSGSAFASSAQDFQFCGALVPLSDCPVSPVRHANIYLPRLGCLRGARPMAASRRRPTIVHNGTFRRSQILRRGKLCLEIVWRFDARLLTVS